MAIESTIAKGIKRGDIAKIEAKVVKNVRALNGRPFELDILKLSNLISTLTGLYSLLLAFLRFILSMSLKTFII